MPSIKIVVLHPVPSLNKLFAMNHWQRSRERKATRAAFMSALRATAKDSLTQITSLEDANTSLTACAMQGLSKTTDRKTFRLKCGKKSQKMSEQKSACDQVV